MKWYKDERLVSLKNVTYFKDSTVPCKLSNKLTNLAIYVVDTDSDEYINSIWRWSETTTKK